MAQIRNVSRRIIPIRANPFNPCHQCPLIEDHHLALELKCLIRMHRTHLQLVDICSGRQGCVALPFYFMRTDSEIARNNAGDLFTEEIEHVEFDLGIGEEIELEDGSLIERVGIILIQLEGQTGNGRLVY